MNLVILVIIVFGVLVDSTWFDLQLGLSPKARLTIATS